MLFIILLVAGILFSFQFKSVQTWAARKASTYLSKELKTKISIGSLHLKPFKSLEIENIFIQDLDKDTLLNSPKIIVAISYFSPFSDRKIILDKITLDNTKLYLKSYKDTTSNLTFIVNYFSSGKIDTSTSRPFDFLINEAEFINVDLKYRNLRKANNVIKGINYDDVYITNLSTNLKNIDFKNHLFQAQINKLKFKEKSGFVLKNLTAFASIDSNKIELDRLLLQTPNTTLTDYFSMKFKSYADFDIAKKVIFEGRFKNAKIYAKDIAFFAPQLSKVQLNFDVSGNIKGTVDNIRAENLTLKAGKATYIKGDFQVKGLPVVENTFLDLDFKQIQTNNADLKYIISKATGKKNNVVPKIIEKFGNINFVGQFTGFVNDFVAYGDFKTKLGRIKSDVNMKISTSGNPSYSGKIQAIDFNLGELIDQPKINRTSFTANVNGRGFDLDRIYEKINAKASYFDYNNYRYKNININGEINRQIFNGKLVVNDNNVKLNFNGKANLNPKLPEFNFIADIKGANLHILNFTKDTVQVDALVKTNFTGNSLDNIQGDFTIQQIRLTNTVKSIVIDSVYLIADGIGTNRLLQLTSDIGDASIKGEYDLATLLSAFKIIVKKYIPSLQSKIYAAKNQNFEFKIDLKNFDYISNLFIPELKIPERGAFNGKFNSEKDSVNLNGFIKTLSYNGTTFSNIIIDENTNSKTMEAIVSMDKIELSDGGIYVQNIIIQNSLKNDSLSFNVKLSDKDAVNQLDLYGLVEFGTDTLAKVSLLPSDLIIDNEIWKIKEQVRIKFENNKTIIENFELTREQQLIAINGAISKDEYDGLEVVVENLKMTSLSQLTKGFGVNLNGTMNGTANLSAILGTPNIHSEITIDSLTYNTTQIGNLVMASNYNNQTNKIDVDAIINKNGNKTLNIKGNVDFKSETNNLNLDVELNKTELIIIEPFVKNLVSKLKGQVTSELKVTGKFKNPEINGFVNLDNAGITVNYLKTAYTINDKVTVDNSIIKINDLRLEDQEGNNATANGSIDMQNPSNPTLNITINAQNFIALNTTLKDNPLYFGKAYSTGKFTFVGPTNSMKINIKAKTEQGTVFTIPLNGASTVSSNDFIVYVAKDSTLNKKQFVNQFNGLTLEFDLSIDDGTQANILTEVGNLTGTGNAQLNLKINSLGDFEMKGDYIINQGKFDFTANNVINKTFDIKKGGTIRWTGDPADAEINLNAVYSTRVSIAPLYSAAGRPLSEGDERKNARIVAEAEMLLKGSLLNPEIDFNLNFPNNSSYTTELQGYLDDRDNEAQQVINLVVRNSFNGNSNSGIGIDNQTLIGSGLELTFSKLNNIVSQSLGLKNLDFNLRSLSEFNIGYSMFNDRLKVSGNIANNTFRNDVFTNSVFNSSLNDLTRDAEMTYDIRKDGSFVGKVFNRPANRDFFNLNSDIYINGIGLVYVQEYDTFKEFIQQTFGRKNKEEEAQKEEEDSDKRSKTLQTPVITPVKEEEK